MFGKETNVLLLHELLKDWPCTFIGDTFQVSILGVTEHSQRVKPGYLFIARKGEHEDGVVYIEEAIRKGAAAIVVDRTITMQLDIPLIVVPSSEQFLSYTSARLAGNPSERLKIIAITGTNGKTTVSHFISQLLNSIGVKVAVFGTLGVFIDGVKKDFDGPSMTTLPAEYLHPMLAKCEALGVTHIIMEASSLGLKKERLTHCEIDVGLLLNISEDHYDEHGGEEAYLLAKQRLMKMAQKVIVNRDDEKCMKIARIAQENKIYFGRSPQADFQLIRQKDKTIIKTPQLIKKISFQDMASFNELNILAAISALNVLSYRYESFERFIERLTLPAGRMEKIDGNGIHVVVDYAHTPDALETVLQSLKENCKGEIIVVFGCGGNRDHGKRKKMGAVVAHYASTVIITSDNPRYEDPHRIIKDISGGIPSEVSPIVEVDRKKAIQKAITCAKKEDIVLIAGKGHEQTQQIGSQTYPFSDKEIARQFLSGLKRQDD